MRVVTQQPPGLVSDGDDEDVFVIEESVGYLVNKVARSFARELSRRIALQDVSIAQWAVLLFLWAEDGVNQRALSRQVAIDEATMARTIDRAERDGLVRRARNRDDRRQINIFLTERGQRLQDALVPSAVEVNDIALSQLSGAEQDMLRSFMTRMIASLDAHGQDQKVETS